MTTAKLDAFFRGILDIEGFSSVDPSMNGLQVDNDGAELAKIAFAVDASLETFKRAARAGAGLLFVHHGLYWGSPLPIVGYFRKRLQFLLENNIALYASHLPLDQHPSLGNNMALADMLGMESPEPFGEYRGRLVGYKGRLKKPLTVQEAARLIAYENQPPLGLYPFGKAESETCAVIAGGASEEALQAISAGVDIYVTGESSHQIYHDILEAGINMIAGGHYATETWGMRKFMEHCAALLEEEVEFIDAPTGL